MTKEVKQYIPGNYYKSLNTNGRVMFVGKNSHGNLVFEETWGQAKYFTVGAGGSELQDWRYPRSLSFGIIILQFKDDVEELTYDLVDLSDGDETVEQRKKRLENNGYKVLHTDRYSWNETT